LHQNQRRRGERREEACEIHQPPSPCHSWMSEKRRQTRRFNSAACTALYCTLREVRVWIQSRWCHIRFRGRPGPQSLQYSEQGIFNMPIHPASRFGIVESDKNAT
jgi:hypothetical protein